MRQDVLAMLWKECLHFRKNAWNEIGVMLLLALFIGTAFPLTILREESAPEILPLVNAALLVFAAYFFVGLVSEGTFSEEISEGTMRMLLTTGIRPSAISLAKWLGLVVRAGALMGAVTLCFVLTVRLSTGTFAAVSVKWLAAGCAAGLLVGAYTAAVNAAMSLLARTAAQLRQLGMLASLVPLMAIVGLARLMGFSRTTVILVGVILFALTLASFRLAIVVFRGEKIRC